MADTSSSSGADSYRRPLFHLQWGLRVLVFRAHHASAIYRLDGPARELDRINRIWYGVNRHVVVRLEFRSHRRTALALRHSPIDGSRRARRVVHFSAFKCPAGVDLLSSRLWNDRLSAVILGAAFGVSDQLSRCGRSW